MNIDKQQHLNDCLKNEDPSVFLIALGEVVKEKGVRHVSNETGLTFNSLYKTFNGKVQPRWETILKVSKAVGLKIQIG